MTILPVGSAWDRSFFITRKGTIVAVEKGDAKFTNQVIEIPVGI